MKNRPKGALSASADKVQSAGRDFSLSGRDSILAHITPQEALLLYTLGGGATTNPVTNRLEFGYGAARDGGRNEGAGAKADKDKSDGGGNGRGGRAGDNGGRGGGIKSGGKVAAAAGFGATTQGGLSTGVGVPGMSVGGMRTFGAIPGSGGVQPGYSNDTYGIAQKALEAKGVSPADAARAIGSQRNYVSASQNGLSIGDRLASFLPGISNTPLDINNPASYANGVRHQNFGLFDALGSIGGSVAGIPGAGMAGGFVGGLVDQALGTHWGMGPDGIDTQTGKAVGYNNDSRNPFAGFGGFGEMNGVSNGNYGANMDNAGRGGALSNPGHLNPQMPGQAPQINQQTSGTSAPTQQMPEVGLYNQNSYPGQYVGIPGPSQYGYTVPQYNYWKK